MPVLFVFPGLERNAADYLNAWRTEASNRNVMVFVFEFPTETYSTAQYIEGGMFQGKYMLDRSEWTFSLIESVFDTVRKDTGSSRTKYDMWGTFCRSAVCAPVCNVYARYSCRQGSECQRGLVYTT